MDIIYFEREKQIIRFMLDTLASKLSIFNPTESYNYLINHPNKEIKELTEVITDAADAYKSDYHTKFIKDVTYPILATICKDEKYIKSLSKTLSLIKGYEINIQSYGKINIFNKAILNAVIKTAHGLLSDKPMVINTIPHLLKEANNELVALLYNEGNKILKEENLELYIPFFNALLYIVYEDTAYFDAFIWIIDKISRKEIKDYIKPFVKSPNLWYCNIWIDSMKITEEKRKKGEIPRYEHSIVERRLVPTKQENDLKRGLMKNAKY